MTFLDHPVVRVVGGALASALAVAGPLVDDGVTPSEAIAIALAFLAGGGFTAVQPSREGYVPQHKALSDADFNR